MVSGRQVFSTRGTKTFVFGERERDSWTSKRPAPHIRSPAGKGFYRNKTVVVLGRKDVFVEHWGRPVQIVQAVQPRCSVQAVTGFRATQRGLPRFENSRNVEMRNLAGGLGKITVGHDTSRNPPGHVCSAENLIIPQDPAAPRTVEDRDQSENAGCAHSR
jgi:hypothetical protein